jgi:pentatricopeptide repeat protein
VWADLNAHLDNLPTPRLCTAFMEALISGGSHEEALSVFRRMEELGTEPDSHAYALAIEAYGCADTEGADEGFGEGSWEGSGDEEGFDFGEESVSYGGRKRPGASTEFKTEAVAIRRGTRGEISRATEAESNGGRTVSGKSGRGLGEVEREGAESSRLHVDPGPDKDPLLDTREQDSFANLEIGPRVRGLGGGLDGGSGAQVNDVEEGLSGKEDIEGSAEVSLTHGARKVAEIRSAPRAFTRAKQLYLKLLEKRRPLSRSVFLAVLKVCRKHGEIREALEVPDQMVAAGVKPDTRVYNALLEVCSAVGNWAAGVRVKQRMVSEGFKANGYTHDIWIRLAGRCRKVDEAVFAFEEMQRLELKRTLVTWNALIGALGAGGRWQEALGRFRGLPEGMTPSVVTYDVVIRLLGRAGRVDEALGVLGEMRGAGFEPRVQLCDVVARALFEQKRWVSFVELMETVEKQGLLSNSGLRERARRVERRLRQQGWRNGSLEQRGKEGVKVTDSLFRRENLSRAGEEDTPSSVEGGAAFTDVDFSFGEGRGTDWAVGEVEGEPHLDGEKATVLSVQKLKGGAAFGTNAGVSYGGEEEGQNIRVEAGESARLQEPGADDEGHRRGGHSPGSSRSARWSNGPDGLYSDPVASAQVESVPGFGKEASARNDQREKDASREKDPGRDDRDQLRRGVDWDSIVGVPPRVPRTVRPKVRRRAKIVAPKTEEWVRYTGRATGQDLVKLLGGHFDESMPSRGQAQKEQRHIVAFRNREAGSSSQESNV